MGADDVYCPVLLALVSAVLALALGTVAAEPSKPMALWRQPARAWRLLVCHMSTGLAVQ